MKERNNFESALKRASDIAFWEIEEEQLLQVARLIVKLGKEPTEKELGEFIQNSGIVEYEVFAMEGLNYSKMITLLNAAQELVAKSDKNDA